MSKNVSKESKNTKENKQTNEKVESLNGNENTVKINNNINMKNSHKDIKKNKLKCGELIKICVDKETKPPEINQNIELKSIEVISQIQASQAPPESNNSNNSSSGIKYNYSTVPSNSSGESKKIKTDNSSSNIRTNYNSYNMSTTTTTCNAPNIPAQTDEVVDYKEKIKKLSSNQINLTIEERLNILENLRNRANASLGKGSSSKALTQLKIPENPADSLHAKQENIKGYQYYKEQQVNTQEPNRYENQDDYYKLRNNKKFKTTMSLPNSSRYSQKDLSYNYNKLDLVQKTKNLLDDKGKNYKYNQDIDSGVNHSLQPQTNYTSKDYTNNFTDKKRAFAGELDQFKEYGNTREKLIADGNRPNYLQPVQDDPFYTSSSLNRINSFEPTHNSSIPTSNEGSQVKYSENGGNDYQFNYTKRHSNDNVIGSTMDYSKNNYVNYDSSGFNNKSSLTMLKKFNSHNPSGSSIELKQIYRNNSNQLVNNYYSNK